jgi:hypothetical protein
VRRTALSGTRRRSVSGFVVKREYWETKPGTHLRVKHREEVSRLYHSRDAALTLMALLQQHNPERANEYYIHEKNRGDDVDLF